MINKTLLDKLAFLNNAANKKRYKQLTRISK